MSRPAKEWLFVICSPRHPADILQWVTFHLEIKPIIPELEESELSCALREDFLEVVGLKLNLKERTSDKGGKAKVTFQADRKGHETPKGVCGCVGLHGWKPREMRLERKVGWAAVDHKDGGEA